MRKPLPSQEFLVERYEYAEGKLFYRYRASQRCRAGDVVGSLNSEGYVVTMIKGTQYSVHGLIWKWHHGTDPSMIDHINRDRSDNRIENLREVTNRKNQWNRGRKLPTCVYKHQGKYVVRCTLPGRSSTYIGIRETVEEAVRLRDEALANYGIVSPA